MGTNSKKGFTLVEIMIVIVIIVLLAAMTIPVFQKVRENSQSRVILQNEAVVDNVEQITSAADKYFSENQVATVAIINLFDDENYIEAADEAAIQVASEDYADTITQGTDYVVTGLQAGAGGAGVDDHTPTPGSTTITVDF